jgi:hypothetical protein
MKSVKIFFVMVSMLVAGHLTASANNTFKGTWDYKVAAAPYEYSTGKLIIGEAEGKPSITVKFNNGTELKGQNVKIENNSFSFGVVVEYETVKITGKIVDGKIAGKVDSSEGTLDLTAVKKQ